MSEATIRPGIYDGISNDAYHGGPGISKSGLDLVHRSPMHYHAAVTAANDNQPTAAQRIGTAFHALVLEPAEFGKTYCLALQRSDVPEAIEDRDQLLAMVAKLNEGRLPKLPTSGSKDALIDMICLSGIETPHSVDDLKALKAADLKAIIVAENEKRPGTLPVSGSRHDLADLLRANGVPVTLWSDVQAEWLANNQQRIVLSTDEWQQLHAMRDSVMAHPAARALLTGAPGKAEQSVYWVDALTGELCRCRPDFWRQDGIIVDVKTTDDASPEGFAKSLVNWRYHVQHPYYLDGCCEAIKQSGASGIVPPKHFLFLVVEKKAPYAVAVYQMDQESIDQGSAEYRADLTTYAECRKTENWPGYGERIQQIGVPTWYLMRHAQGGN